MMVAWTGMTAVEMGEVDRLEIHSGGLCGPHVRIKESR